MCGCTHYVTVAGHPSNILHSKLSYDKTMHATETTTPLPCDAAAAERTLIMGILNVTPDSFSDGGEHYTANDAIAHAHRMLEAGADIIDIGGESTRPGAAPVSVTEEQRRILPVIEALTESSATISVDTMNPATARAAITAGAHIINDVSGMSVSNTMIETAAELAVPYILMHARGTSTTMDTHASYPRGAVTEVIDELLVLRERFVAAGCAPGNIIFDPGLGFAKTAAQNWQLLAATGEFQALGHRLLIGASRKRFIASALATADQRTACALQGNTAEPAPRLAAGRDAASAAITAVVAQQRVWAVRVHDVPSSIDAVTVVARIQEFTSTPSRSCAEK